MFWNQIFVSKQSFVSKLRKVSKSTFLSNLTNLLELQNIWSNNFVKNFDSRINLGSKFFSENRFSTTKNWLEFVFCIKILFLSKFIFSTEFCDLFQNRSQSENLTHISKYIFLWNGSLKSGSYRRSKLSLFSPKTLGQIQGQIYDISTSLLLIKKYF